MAALAMPGALHGAQDEAPVPQVPPGASPRAAEHIRQLRLDIPPAVAVSHSLSYRLSVREDADSRRLDVYRDQTKGRAPVVIFFHGGAWRSGHRRQYIPLGVSFALGGITCVIPSYSLAPKYKFPEPLKDAAAAINWVRDNIHRLGGNPDRIFLAGHSSGAHIAAQVALDSRYLDFHFQGKGIIRGVVGISGIYAIGPGFEYAFGADPSYWAEASPLHFAREFAPADAPPFLLVAGTEDAPGIEKQTEALAQALKSHRVLVEKEIYPGEDHSSIIALASLRQSSLQEQIREFVRSNS
ncbi:MAG: alpha/beta hydrolase [Bryobacterales bacterium]|nr:alpha/beta hydrolase [Bryobacterales bacterium]